MDAETLARLKAIVGLRPRSEFGKHFEYVEVADLKELIEDHARLICMSGDDYATVHLIGDANPTRIRIRPG